LSKETFKEFVRKNPRLLRYIKNKEMTWQSFYEIYDMYGESSEAWKSYLEDKKEIKTSNIDFMNYLKNIDLDAVQESINSIQRVLGVVSDLTISKQVDNNIEPKPLYQHLDD
jgi:hypothetical protein